MKKLVFLLVCFFTLQTVARADDDKPIQVTGTAVYQTAFCRQQSSISQNGK